MTLLLSILPLPSLVGFPILKKPTFASLVHSPPSGREVTGFQQVYPLWEFELPFEILRDQSQNQSPFAPTIGFTDMTTLSAFWLECGSQFGSFVYQDPTDYARTDQLIGFGDGVSRAFTIVRTFGIGAYSLVEPVGIVDARAGQPLNVYVDGSLVPQTDNWWIDENLHVLRFVSPPAFGAVITMDFNFFYMCRFIEDSLELEEFMTGRWTVKKLRFRSMPSADTAYTLLDIDEDVITPQDLRLISHAIAQSTDTVNATTPAIDTTGAKFLVCGTAYFFGPLGIEDTYGNTWVGLGIATHPTTSHHVQMFICTDPTVGPGHTVHVSAGTGYPGVAFAAFGGPTDLSFDLESGNTSTASTFLEPGSVTPSSDGELVMYVLGDQQATTVSVDVGEVIDQLPATANALAIAMAYDIQASAAAISPKFSWTGNADAESIIAAFSP